jgi:hypothetical protein
VSVSPQAVVAPVDSSLAVDPSLDAAVDPSVDAPLLLAVPLEVEAASVDPPPSPDPAALPTDVPSDPSSPHASALAATIVIIQL